MTSRVLWVAAFGALAYLLETTGFPFEALTKTVLYVASFLLVLLIALSGYFREHRGRFPSSADSDATREQSLFRSDPVFGLGATTYAGVYLIVLRFSDSGGPYRMIEWFLQFTPTELFWLIAPIYLFWNFRKQVRAKRDAQ